MAYRKGYYRKDGTYVEGHFTNHRSKKIVNKGKGCILLLAVFIAIVAFI